MTWTHVVGVDPGLVHTGLVKMMFDRRYKRVDIQAHVLIGTDIPRAIALIDDPQAIVFIEGYRARSNFDSDERMTNAVATYRKELGGTVLQNMGVKKIVKAPLMELLEVWQFPGQPTHHQDLRSAARIALFGMLKDDHLNQLLTDVVADHLAGEAWNVHRR